MQVFIYALYPIHAVNAFHRENIKIKMYRYVMVHLTVRRFNENADAHECGTEKLGTKNQAMRGFLIRSLFYSFTKKARKPLKLTNTSL